MNMLHMNAHSNKIVGMVKTLEKSDLSNEEKKGLFVQIYTAADEIKKLCDEAFLKLK